eukprot:4243568-Ditylum_brightwellii.AAC.1
MPVWFVMLQMSVVRGSEADNGSSEFIPSAYALGYLTIDGLFFYLQSISAYKLMDLVSPVTHSVTNCVKRALLIWISVLFWHNKVGPINAAGTFVLLGGVLLYNHQLRQKNPQPSLEKSPDIKSLETDGERDEESEPLNKNNDD